HAEVLLAEKDDGRLTLSPRSVRVLDDGVDERLRPGRQMKRQPVEDEEDVTDDPQQHDTDRQAFHARASTPGAAQSQCHRRPGFGSGSALFRRGTWRVAVVTAGAPTLVVLVLFHVPKDLRLAQTFVLGHGTDVRQPLCRAMERVAEGRG